MKSQAQRRLLVIGIFVGFFLIIGSFWLAAHVQKLLLALAIPAFALFGYCYWQVSHVVRGYSYPDYVCRNVTTDERQAKIRDRSFVIAYQILAICFSIFGVAVMFVMDFSWFRYVTHNTVQAVLWFVLLLAAALPSCVVAWTLPDFQDEPLPEVLVTQHR